MKANKKELFFVISSRNVFSAWCCSWSFERNIILPVIRNVSHFQLKHKSGSVDCILKKKVYYSI